MYLPDKNSKYKKGNDHPADSSFSDYELPENTDYHEPISLDLTVNDLLSSGVNNIKERIELLTAMMREREYLKEKIVKNIISEKNRLHTGLLNECSSYHVFNSPNLISRKTSLETHIARLEAERGKEEIECFKDLLDLNKELQYAKELYSKEKLKKKLVEE